MKASDAVDARAREWGVEADRVLKEFNNRPEGGPPPTPEECANFRCESGRALGIAAELFKFASDLRAAGL